MQPTFTETGDHGATTAATAAADWNGHDAELDPDFREPKMRGLIESALDAMVVVGEEGTIVLVNAQAERMFGYRRAELLGRRLDMLVPERFRHIHEDHEAAYFHRPYVRLMGEGPDLFGLCKDGSEIALEISLSPLKTDEGTLVSAMIRDVTITKKFEKALREQNVELEAAIQARDRFLASMSHELRTPLNAIIGFTGTLMMGLAGPLNTEQRQQLQTIKTSSNHLLSLINDLLDLAKIESGKTTLTLEDVLCAEVLDEVAVSLRPLAESKGLTLIVAEAPRDLIVRADRRAFSQILINLINNAIKFTERGRIRVVVDKQESLDSRAGTPTAHPEEQGSASKSADGPKATISVVDTGMGITEDDQAKLFEAFAQCGLSSFSKSEGTGLGLYLSQKLASLMNGGIKFVSTFGEGSTFTLTLPCS